MHRRSFLAGIVGATGLALTGPARAQGADYWYTVRGDDGGQVPNLHLSADLMNAVQGLPGLISGSAANATVTMVEFFDYNCPTCRRAAPELRALAAEDGRIRLSFVNIPVLSPFSVEAAKVELAVHRLHGGATAEAFQKKLILQKGVATGARALDLAAAMGLPRPAIEAAAADPALDKDIAAHIGLADQIGFDATPSFVISDAGIIGYPGQNAIMGMVGAVRKCGVIDCTS